MPDGAPAQFRVGCPLLTAATPGQCAADSLADYSRQLTERRPASLGIDSLGTLELRGTSRAAGTFSR